MIKTVHYCKRAWLTSEYFDAIRCKAFSDGKSVYSNFRITDGHTTICIHSNEDEVGLKPAQDFVVKLTILIQALEQYLKLDPKDPEVYRTWLNPKDCHYTGSVTFYMQEKTNTNRLFSSGIKISDCTRSIMYLASTPVALKINKTIVKKIVREVTRLKEVTIKLIDSTKEKQDEFNANIPDAIGE